MPPLQPWPRLPTERRQVAMHNHQRLMTRLLQVLFNFTLLDRFKSYATIPRIARLRHTYQLQNSEEAENSEDGWVQPTPTKAAQFKNKPDECPHDGAGALGVKGYGVMLGKLRECHSCGARWIASGKKWIAVEP